MDEQQCPVLDLAIFDLHARGAGELYAPQELYNAIVLLVARREPDAPVAETWLRCPLIESTVSGKIISTDQPDWIRNSTAAGGMGVMKLLLNFEPLMGA